MTDKIRVAVIGTSWWAEGAHLPGLRANPRVEVTALCGRNPERLAQMAARFGVPSTFTDHHRMLAEARPEVVFVVTPNHEHAAMTLAALEAGAHVVCEKPLALHVAEAERMLARAEELGRRHLTFFTYRGMPGPRFVKQLVEQGYLGRLHHAHASYLHASWLNPERLATWKTARAQGGSGVLGDLGTHVIDLFQWWFGPITRVAGSLQTFIPERPRADGTRARVETDDAAAFVAEFAHGAQATVQLSRVAPGRRNYQRLELYGANGVLVYDYEQALAHVGRVSGGQGPAGEPQPLPIPTEMSAGFAGPETFPAVHRAVIDPFLDSLPGPGPAPAPSFADGLAAQRVIEAVARSVDHGRWEAVN
jgi:predicted dehydrogenase